eukprot:GGOE01036106.1.p2 GENE.GGOE01036106.1~~GGOE01036106.1.p2  ORF type:complete len:114 (-),score=15.64 GGOE01036106.1:215-556(-)
MTTNSHEIAEIDNLAAELNNLVRDDEDDEDDEEEPRDKYEHMILVTQKYFLKPFVVAFAVALGLSTGYAFFDFIAAVPFNPFRSRAVPRPVLPPAAPRAVPFWEDFVKWLERK